MVGDGGHHRVDLAVPMTAGASISVVLAAIAGAALAVATVELSRSSPRLVASLGRAVDPLLRVGTEGRPPTEAERRRLGALTGLGFGSVTALALGLGPAAIVAAAGPSIAGWALSRRAAAYREAVEEELGAIAVALADGLGAGLPPRRAVLEAAAGFDGPAGVELARVRSDLESGLPLAAALEGMASRVGGAEIEAMTRAIASGERMGGNLALMLRRHAEAAGRRRASLEEARAATSQARLTGVVVAGLPLLATALVELAAPGFIVGILGDPVAAMLVAVSGVIQLGGFLLIRRLGEADR